MRRFLAFLFALLLSLTLFLPAVAADPPVATEVTLIHDTHTHGNFESGKTNIAQKAYVVNEIRSRHPGALFVGNGDDLGTSILSSEFRGTQMIEALEAMGLAVNGVGNHDFDAGPKTFLAGVREAHFPWVSANLRASATGGVFGAAAGVKEYVIIETNGVKVGFTGLTPFETPTSSSPGPDVTMQSYAEAMRRVLPQMRQDGADVTVLLSHICANEAEKLAIEIEGIDVILGDHCATTLEQPKKIGNTIISRVGDEYHYVGELTLVLTGSGIGDFRFTRHELTEKSPTDPKMVEIMTRYKQRLDAGLSQVIGSTETPLDAVKADNRLRETGLGNFLADVARQTLSADVGILNGGGVRADRVFAPGPLAKKDIIEMQPFQNVIMKLAVTGAQLKAALENGFSAMGQGQGRFPQVSGMTVRVDPSRAVGDRVLSVMVGSKPLDPSAQYTLAINSFLAGGGDGYAMLKEAKVLIDANSGPKDSTAAVDAVLNAKKIAPRVEGRIQIVSGVSVELGKTDLLVTGVAQPMGIAPAMKGTDLLVPLRAITEFYGATIEWDQPSRTATVTMPWGARTAVKAGTHGHIVSDRLLVPGSVLEALGIHTRVEGGVMQLSL